MNVVKDPQNASQGSFRENSSRPAQTRLPQGSLRLGFLCGASQEPMLCDFAYACLWSFQGLTWIWASLSPVPSASLSILGTLFLGPHFTLLTPPQERGYYDIQFFITGGTIAPELPNYQSTQSPLTPPIAKGGKKPHLGKLAYTRGFTIMAMLGLVDICLKDWHSNLQDLVSVVSSLPAFMTKMQLLPIETPQ